MTNDNAVIPGAGSGQDQPSATDHAGQLRYWRTQLRGAILAELPTDRSRQRVPGAGATQAFQLPPKVSAALLALMNTQGAALLDLTVAAVAIVLARYTGGADLTVATVAPWPGGGTRILPLPRLGGVPGLSAVCTGYRRRGGRTPGRTVRIPRGRTGPRLGSGARLRGVRVRHGKRA
jgi:hypothetical protein